MKKIGLLALGLALALGVVAEAGSIPGDRVPLQTYAVKKMNCYLQPNGVQKGWIDPGDYVVVTQIRSDGWAYGSYPVGNGRVSRWFRADDLVNNIGFANQERYSPKANTNTYTGPDHSRKFGSFNDNETLLVVSESGESRQFIYKLNNGGYKMAWAPYWDCWDARQAGKQQVNNNVINRNPIVKPVQREDKKQEQSSSYGVWKATARYRANTYDNPNLSGARAGWVTAGSDLEVLGENAKSYFIRYWADNGAKRERYVERTAVKGLNEDKDNKQQVNNNVINKNPIVKPVQREDKKQEQASSYGVWKATARYRANTYDNPNLSGARAGWVTAGSDLEVLGENAKSYFIRYWADNGAKRERYVERTAVKGLNEDKENKQQVNNNVINRNPIVKPVQREDKKQEQSSSYGVWKATARYTANTYDNPNLSGAKAGRVTADSSIEVLGENAKSYYIRYWTDNGTPRELYVERTAVKGLNEKNEIINNNSGDSNKKLLQLCQTWQNRSWQPYGKGDGSNSKWPNGERAFGGQCLGFANYIFQEIHGRKCGDGYGEIKYKLSRLKEGVKELSSSSWLNSQKAKEMLSNAPVGSFLQLKRRSSGSQHSAILVSKDSNGVRILDANSNLDNVVKYTFWTFSAFANKNTAMSIYNI